MIDLGFNGFFLWGTEVKFGVVKLRGRGESLFMVEKDIGNCFNYADMFCDRWEIW